MEELFASFDDKPLGSSSIGQVHKAELFDGTVVAVKVRRPGGVETVARDFAPIEKVNNTFLKNGIADFDIKGFIVELEKTSKAELDFTNEATNLERFYEFNFTGSDFGDFELGDLLGVILTNLQDESYDIDPFLTNLSRGIIAVEGTVKTINPRVNILNYSADGRHTVIGALCENDL